MTNYNENHHPICGETGIASLAKEEAKVTKERKFISQTDKVSKALCFLKESIRRLEETYSPVIRQNEPIKESSAVKASDISCDFEAFVEDTERQIIIAAENINDIIERSAV